MATTTNYSWTTPDDTALVKDGASAIRSLGTAIDSTVFTNAGNAINKTIVDAKGDIIAATAADTVSRLAVGANDTVLVADSSTATGLKWAAPASGGMTLISTTTLTGASVSLTSIPQTYNDLRIVIRNFKPSGDSESLRIEFNGDSTANRHRSDYVYDAGSYDTTATFNAPWGKITTDLDNSVANGITVMDIFDYTNTTTWKMGEYLTYNTDPTTTTSFQMRKGAIFYNQTSAISSFDFFPSGGTMTSGTVLLYGVK
jgi:hypothetical protein